MTLISLSIFNFLLFFSLFFFLDNWYWELTIVGRKLFFAAVGVFGRNSGQMQVHVTSMFLMFIILLTAIVRPFNVKYQGENYFQPGHLLQILELVSLTSIWLTLWAALVFSTYPRCEANYGAAQNDKDESADGEDSFFSEPGTTLPWCDATAVFVGVMDVFVVCAVAAGLIYKMYRSRLYKIEMAESEKKHGGRMSVLHMSSIASIAANSREFALDLENRVEGTNPTRMFSLAETHRQHSKRGLAKQSTYSYVMEHAKAAEEAKQQEIMAKEMKHKDKIDGIIEKEHEDEDVIVRHLSLQKENTHTKLEVRKAKAKAAKEKVKKSSLYLHHEVDKEDDEGKDERKDVEVGNVGGGLVLDVKVEGDL